MAPTNNTVVWIPLEVQEQIHIDSFYSYFEPHYKYGYFFAGESHNFWECVYILEGTLCVSADERVYNLNRGEIIFHKPLELHKFTVTSEEGASLLIFSYALSGPLEDALKDKVFKLSDAQQEIVSSMRKYVDTQNRSTVASDDNITLHNFFYLQDKSSQLHMLSTYVCQLILSLTGDGKISEVSHTPDAKTFKKAVYYMNSRLDCQPAVREIAHYCNISESSLKRLFDKYAGISIHKYFLKLKLKAATDLLSNGCRVADVAEKLGFSSQAYFSTVFKRETGHNPTQIK